MKATALPSERTVQQHRLWLFISMEPEKAASFFCQSARCFMLSADRPAYPKVSRLCSSTVVTTSLKSTHGCGPLRFVNRSEPSAALWRRERLGDHHGNLLPMRRSDTNEQSRASAMPRVLGRLRSEIQPNPE